MHSIQYTLLIAVATIAATTVLHAQLPPDYFPLAVNNSWTFTSTNTGYTETIISKETDNDGHVWYLFNTFRGVDGVYVRLSALAPAKPVLIAEFGATNGHPLGDQAAWAEAALRDVRNGRWPSVAGFVWWNGSWENDGRPGTRTTMRLADNPALARAFRRALAGIDRIPVPSADR